MGRMHVCHRAPWQKWQVTPPVPPSLKRRLGEGPGLPPDLRRRAMAGPEAPTPLLRPGPPEERDAGDRLSLSLASGEVRMGEGSAFSYTNAEPGNWSALLHCIWR